MGNRSGSSASVVPGQSRVDLLCLFSLIVTRIEPHSSYHATYASFIGHFLPQNPHKRKQMHSTVLFHLSDLPQGSGNLITFDMTSADQTLRLRRAVRACHILRLAKVPGPAFFYSSKDLNKRKTCFLSQQSSTRQKSASSASLERKK